MPTLECKSKTHRLSAKNRIPLGAVVLVGALLAGGSVVAREDDFDRVVAPLLARRCLECHNRSDKKGGLDLSSEKSALAGGDSGQVLVPGNPADSLLSERVSKREMPPKAPLSDAEQQVLESWISGGAKWGTDPIDPFQFTTDHRAGYDWWSLQPVTRPFLPNVADESWEQNPIDRFVLASLEARGLAPAAPADKRVLIRRLAFDLLGLPPDPAEVDAFLADGSPDAYLHVVERYLKSPHYGERWARHWLDIIRFGESQGFERDKLRPNAWPYRDWVISAFNDDLPYDEFVRLQLAGDVLHPEDPRGTIATGFLVAAPWDEVGQTQQSVAMKAVVRQDELEDLLAVTGQTFLGLTVNCARCHDHKFDPITQAEYYKLAAMLAGSRHGERESSSAASPDPAIANRREELARSEQQFAKEIAGIDGPIRQRIMATRANSPAPAVDVPPPIACWEFNGDLKDSIGGLHGQPHGSARVDNGKLLLDGKDSFVDTPPLPTEIGPKTLEVWLTLASLDQRGGGAMTIQSPSGAIFDSVVFGERETGQWMAGSNGFSRWQSFLAPVETEAGRDFVKLVIVYGADRTITAYRNGRRYGTPYTAPALAIFEAGKAQILFGLRHSPPGGDRFLAGEIDRAALFGRALDAEQVAALAGVPSDVVTESQIMGMLSREILTRRRELQFELSRVQMEKRLLAGVRAYAVTPAAPEATYILARGNPGQKQELVGPGVIRSLRGISGELGIGADASDGVRRQRLAEWITDVHNPLTPRVIANRLWHYHFGIGIVDTPNDFGFNGGRPTHPELLDWLASELIAPTVDDLASGGRAPIRRELFPAGAPADTTLSSGATPPGPPLLRRGKAWSLKHLHRLIVTSATYRQSSASNPQAIKVDAGNRLFWRRSPQRLDAESLRDAMLVVAGEFNPQMGGPGFQDFRTFTFNSQFYEPIDPVGFEFNRRTLYRTWVRSGRNEFLDVFDCPDPSAAAPRRAVTTTPLQALALLNNSFTLRMAERLAARVERKAEGDLDAQIAYLYRLAYDRAPIPEEAAETRQHVAAHGMAALCRVIFNSNEFLYVD
jgi:hypothetical protein